jgi:hypothetical protein
MSRTMVHRCDSCGNETREDNGNGGPLVDWGLLQISWSPDTGDLDLDCLRLQLCPACLSIEKTRLQMMKEHSAP